MDGGVSKERVLIVDDEPQILVALEDLLGDDFVVLKSSTPESALEVVRDDPNIAVVVTDQRMPRMTGDELLSKMTFAPAVGIMVSGFADLPAVIRAINEGKVFAYVTKPWNAEDLRFKVAKGVEHFRLARQIAHERQLLSDLMNSSPDGIFFKDKDLKIQRANRSFAQVLGVSAPEELLGRRLRDGLVPVELAARIEAEEQALMLAGTPSVDVVRQYRGAAGSEWYSESKAPIRGPGGEIEGLVAISRDVTERLRTQEALRQSEERLRQQSRILNSILDGIGEGVIVVDSGGQTLLFNSEAQRVLGAQARDVPPEHWASEYGVYLPDGRTLVPLAENPLVRAMHGSRKVEMEVIIKNSGVPEARVALVATPLRNDSGEVMGAITLLRDVTQKHSLEQLLVHSQKMEAVGQLAGGVAHDFNNLLAVIEGSGEMALEELVGHVAREDVADMVTAAKRAAVLTRQLLAFSRREAARPEPVQLAGVVRGVEKMLRRLIGEHITLLTHLEEVSPITADSSQLEQVLVNLCVNARDAMPEGGTLRIELLQRPRTETSTSAESEVVLRISDTGTGMDPELVKRIFEPFFTTKEVGKGTGLGLSMVYGIVTQNGGQIAVESSLGRGSTFTITFPVTDIGQAAQLASSSPRERAPGTGTVLLVEDDPSVRNITARILRRHGYVVVEAGRPSEARAASETGDHIDLLLTDLVMPEMTGVKLAEELILARPGLRVLYMTGYAGAALKQAQSGLPRAEERVIQKPFTSDALLDRVRGALLAGPGLSR